MSEEKTKKSKTTKIIIILVSVLAVIIAFTIGGYFAYKYSQDNKTVGTEWGDLYYSYLKSVKEADEEKIKEAGLSKDIESADIRFVQVKKEDNPKMILTYEKDNEQYTNIYFITEEQQVSVITYNHPTTLKLLYNRESNEYLWYLYSKENDENMYKSLDKILKEVNTSEISNSEEAESTYADYTFKDSEMKSNLDVAEGEKPTISKFDQIFIEVEVIDDNTFKISFVDDDKELKQVLIKIVGDYKTKEEIITEEVKKETENGEKILEEKAELIKEIEQKEAEEKAKAEEEARKKAEEEAKKKAEEDAKKKAEQSAATTSSTGRISKEQAAKLAEKIDGTTASETGFPIGYSLEAMVKDSTGLEYYLFRVRWLVDNSHWSTIDGVAVSVDGKKWKQIDIYQNYSDGQTIKEVYKEGTF